jgi:hypothetical protein
LLCEDGWVGKEHISPEITHQSLQIVVYVADCEQCTDNKESWGVYRLVIFQII